MTAPLKYQSVLESVQDACLQLGLGRPAGVYDSQDAHAQQMGSFINNLGQLLLDTYEWQQFKEDFSITGDGSTTVWPLPDNFNRILGNTGWSYALRRPVGVVDDAHWAGLKAWVGSSFYYKPVVRIRDNSLEFLTAPALNELVKFTIVNGLWVQDADMPSTRKPKCGKNGDIPMFDWLVCVFGLKKLWLESKGLDSTAATAEMEARIEQTKVRNVVAAALSLNGGAQGVPYINPDLGMPITGYGH